MTTLDQKLEAVTKTAIRNGLRAIKKGMEEGRYIDVHLVTHKTRGKRVFNMAVPAKSTDCGTMCCIGGWLGYELGARTPDQAEIIMSRCEHVMPRLGRLFYNDLGNSDPAHAAKRIGRFLANKHPDA
jgi:hypothetical protein